MKNNINLPTKQYKTHASKTIHTKTWGDGNGLELNRIEWNEMMIWNELIVLKSPSGENETILIVSFFFWLL